MSPAKAAEAYHKKQPVTLKKNVQALRQRLCACAMLRAVTGSEDKHSFTTDPSGLVGRPLRIEFIDARGTFPFVRVTGVGNIRPKIKTKAGDKVELAELMIPIDAITPYKVKAKG